MNKDNEMKNDMDVEDLVVKWSVDLMDGYFSMVKDRFPTSDGYVEAVGHDEVHAFELFLIAYEGRCELARLHAKLSTVESNLPKGLFDAVIDSFNKQVARSLAKLMRAMTFMAVALKAQGPDVEAAIGVQAALAGKAWAKGWTEDGYQAIRKIMMANGKHLPERCEDIITEKAAVSASIGNVNLN